MKLPRPPSAYSEHDQGQMRAAIEMEDAKTFKKGRDVEMTAGTKLILQSPNGTRYYLTASNLGALTLTAV